MSETLFNKTYELLTGDEDARVCRDIPADACNAQPRNYTLHLASLSLTKTGDKFVDPKIMLAWMLSALGAPGAFISLLVPVHNAFSLLPQLIVAGYIRRLPVRKWLWCAGSIGQALALVGLAGVALGLRGTAAGVAVVGCLLLFSLSRGVCSVAYKDVLGKTVSKTRRGSVSGYADAFAGLVAAGLAVWLINGGGRDIDTIALVFLVAAVLWLIAAASFSRLEEIPGSTEGGANAINAALSQASLLSRDVRFRRFVVSRTLLLGTALIPPYLVVLTPGLGTGDLQSLGYLLLAASLAGFITAPLWGLQADRSSRRTLFAAGLLTAIFGLVAAVVAAFGTAGPLFVACCVFGVYVGHAGVRIGRKTHLVDMASEENRAAFVAVSNTVIGIALLGFALLGAVVDNFISFGGLFFFSGMALCGAGLSLRLEEVQQPQTS